MSSGSTSTLIVYGIDQESTGGKLLPLPTTNADACLVIPMPSRWQKSLERVLREYSDAWEELAKL